MPTQVIRGARGVTVVKDRSDSPGGELSERRRQGFVRDFYVYVADVTFTATSERRPVNVNLQADADFVLVKITATVSDATPPARSGGAFLNLIDSGSDRRLFDTQAPLSAVTGTGQRPFILPWVHRFARNGTLVVDITNDGTATMRAILCFAGYKIIPESRL